MAPDRLTMSLEATLRQVANGSPWPVPARQAVRLLLAEVDGLRAGLATSAKAVAQPLKPAND